MLSFPFLSSLFLILALLSLFSFSYDFLPDHIDLIKECMKNVKLAYVPEWVNRIGPNSIPYFLLICSLLLSFASFSHALFRTPSFARPFFPYHWSFFRCLHPFPFHAPLFSHALPFHRFLYVFLVTSFDTSVPLFF
jgi:hypothetical protein